ncbi:MAG: hypothetical protein HOK25_14125, partial [Rhodospirillaceae bacterium]|nr:hypothetical protein [Rhodospirillaceae bacterium]
MPSDVGKQKSGLINKVVRHAQSKLKGAKAKKLEAFTRQYLANLPASDLDGMAGAAIFN